jgi:nitrate/nitrite-specific signal transduction histidine kinase
LALASYLALRQAFQPIVALTGTINAVVAGDWSRSLPVERGDELGALARAFNGMTSQIRDLIHTLESRVADRTRDLEQRATYLAVTTQVSRVVNAILDVDELLPRVAHLITDRFGFYHVAIFMLDESGEWDILRAASSERGQGMVARGHRLRVGEQGIVGYVSSSGRPRIALDVDVDAVWMKSPDLPTTRSEMALPLSVGDRVLVFWTFRVRRHLPFP